MSHFLFTYTARENGDAVNLFFFLIFFYTRQTYAPLSSPHFSSSNNTLIEPQRFIHTLDLSQISAISMFEQNTVFGLKFCDKSLSRVHLCANLFCLIKFAVSLCCCFTSRVNIYGHVGTVS